MSRQAVIVIHGIGKQRPMDTLRGFVEAVLPDPRSDRVKFLSVPDRMSESFELRRLLAPQTRTRPITDFFEYYWAYQVRGTRYGHLLGWIKTLLFRSPASVSLRLVLPWSLIWLLIVGLLLASVRLAPVVFRATQTDPFGRIITWLVSVVLLPLVSGFALGYLGDAARYLSPIPENIAVRRRIRGEGVRLLRHLHRCGSYDRIVVVGHSLGSVIAYDILKHYWQEVHARHKQPLNVDQSRLKRLEVIAAAGGSESNQKLSSTEFQAHQRELWLEQRQLGNPWLVSDLVTVGSPLAHAAMLLANSPAELRARQHEMELPTIPPERNLEGQFAYPVNYDVQGQKRTLRVLHHGALFACTRWTNIWFPGDLVGGPLAPLFGPGVNDRLVQNEWVSFTPSSHTRYWLRRTSDRLVQPSIAAIREAMDLESKKWLTQNAAAAASDR